MAKVLHISDVDMADLFECRSHLLGDPKGKWFVVDDEDDSGD